MALLLWVRARSEALSRLIVAVEDSDADVQYSIVEYLNIERDGGLDASVGMTLPLSPARWGTRLSQLLSQIHRPTLPDVGLQFCRRS